MGVASAASIFVRQQADAALLVQRLRICFWISLFSIGLFALGDLRLSRSALQALYLLKGAQVAALSGRPAAGAAERRSASRPRPPSASPPPPPES